MEPVMAEEVNMAAGVKENISPFYQPVEQTKTSPDLQDTRLVPTNSYIEYLRGYLDCATESIRFLTEVEGFPNDHPFVIGLQKDLQQHMQMMRFQMLLCDVLNMETNNVQKESTEIDTCACEITKQEVDNGSKSSPEEDTGTHSEINHESDELAKDIADEIYKLLYCTEGDEENSDISDSDTSLDEGFHENSDVESNT